MIAYYGIIIAALLLVKFLSEAMKLYYLIIIKKGWEDVVF